ncbi:MAG: ribonuclease P protein component [Candidatus Lumbricidophila eiseniae]|uniref:Ribonuclease P protein component n=1 Tax=Candidatus Lumbricidiphila eiseniae TaxID=1969409 RepID=A0A2A6FRC3_9MICO|nr:MAG: ribonuclease P protein component [Candidatus Lumbricidophila eiseniae]
MRVGRSCRLVAPRAAANFLRSSAVLPRRHRLLNDTDFRDVVRRGARNPGRFLVVHARRREPDALTRFGFVVNRKVGNAVVRNKVRRRLRSMVADLLESGVGGLDVVVRVLPPASSASYSELREDLARSLSGHRIRFHDGALI